MENLIRFHQMRSKLHIVFPTKIHGDIETNMRIIDKRKDYYDSGQAWGTEPSIVYVREEIEIRGPKKSYSDKRFAVGFCGNIYFGYRLYYTIKDENNRLNPKDIPVSCYSIEDVDRFYKAHCPKEIEKYNPPKITQGKHKWKYTRPSPREKIKLWLENGTHTYSWKATEPIQYPDYFSKYQTPVWSHIQDTGILTINPLLKDWEFFRVKDAYTAYNEISNFVGGVLQHPMRPIPEIDDKTKIELAGFDTIKSFRKEKNDKQ